MNKYLSDLRLGDLLAKTGIVSVKQMTEAMRTAGNRNLHFGQMLVKSGCLKSSDLSAGIAAQSAIRDKTIDCVAAGRALETACRTGVSFNEALRSIGARAGKVPTNRLGQLIVESGLLTAEQCQNAIAKSLSTGLPVGRILVSNNLLSEDTLVGLLELQLRVRDGLLTREEAVSLIVSSPEKIYEPAQAVNGQHSIRLGELMVRAGILTRTDVINVLEVGLHSNQRTGQLLVKFGFISDSLLESALNLQQMVENKFIRVEQASKCLKHVEEHGSSISEALVQLEMLTLPRASSQGNPNFDLADRPRQGNPDSTFGAADRTSLTAMDSRTRKLIRSLRSAAEPRVSPQLGIAYGALARAYTRLAIRHIHYGDYREAEWLYERILSIRERLVGQSDISLVTDLKSLSEVLVAQKKFGGAETTMRRALALLENNRPYDGPFFATCLNVLAMIYFEQGFYEDAEPLLTRALTLKELNYPPDHPELADTLRDYARLLAKTNRHFEAEKVYYQARAILLRQQNAEPESFFEKMYINAWQARK